MEPATPNAPNAERPSPRPVMDVVPPRAVDAVKPAPAEVPQPATGPSPSEPPAKATPKAEPLTSAAGKRRDSTGLAIVATVIIVLGIGAMMLYAYLRSQDISLPF